MNKSGKIYCRCSEKDKLKIKDNATSHGITVTELIIKSCKTCLVWDKKLSKDILVYDILIYSELSIRRVNAFTPGLGAAPLCIIKEV